MLRISIISAVIFAIVVVFLSYQMKDASIPPGTQGQFAVTRSSLTQPEAIAAIETAAQKLNINVYKRGTNPAQVSAAPWYFSFIGNSESHNKNMGVHGYPAFDPSRSPSTISGSEIGNQGVTGSYTTTAGGPVLKSLLVALDTAGIENEITSETALETFLRGVLTTSSAPILIALLLALGLSVFYTASYNRKSSGIKFLHGYGTVRRAAAELFAFSRLFFVAGLALSACTTVFLLLYNGLNQYFQFMAWLLASLGVIYIFMLLAYAAALIALPPLRIAQLLKGEKPLTQLGMAAGLTQAVSLVLVYAVATTAWTSYSTLTKDELSLERWAGEEHSVTMQINPYTLNDRDSKNIDPAVRQVFRDFLPTYTEMDSRGMAVLSVHPRQNPNQTEARGLSPYNPESGNSLIVNNTYLDRNAVLDESGGRIVALPKQRNHIELLVPSSAKSDTARIVNEFRNLNWHTWELGTPMGTLPPVDISVTYTKDGQDIFNYGDTADMKSWIQRDPVIAVVTEASDFFSGWYLLTVAANSGQITFTEPKELDNAVVASGLDKHLVGVSSSSIRALEELDKRKTEMAMHLVNIAVSFLVLLLSISILAAIYVDRNRVSVFLKHVHGWTYFRTHGFYVLINGMGGALALLVATNTISELARTERTLALLIGGILLVFALTGVMVAVQADEKKTRGDYVKRS
ncbi:hypothetical protein M1D88_09800 [Arthrobacter sp. R1-13]